MKIFGAGAKRSVRTIEIAADFVVVGGGLAGVCAAVSAAREGTRVCLVQDRPVLGGNASSEIRVWALGATSHMGNNNRFSREGGIIDEILTENMYRNKEGNPILFDMLLMDKVLAEKNITLLLNTAVLDLKLSSSRDTASHIESVTGFCASSETMYVISGKLFADCSGDGIISHLAGAAYRVGAEDKEVYGEGFAPDTEKYGELMGDTIFFYMKDTGRPVKYVAPSFALKDAEKHISKIQNKGYFNTGHHGCKYWWLEWGGRLDTIHDTENIKRELWKVVYGIWDHIKNSGKFPEMENYTLEWVGTIPGKRESRRMKGLYTLTQEDIVSGRSFHDGVSYGGWAVDLHPADGVYADGAACDQWHSKGVYQIPYRCFIGADVDNLFFAGRIISTSHVANGSTRVMCTCAHGGAVVGTAAALCLRNNVLPVHYADEHNVTELRLALEEYGHFVPGWCESDKDNLLGIAQVSASSTYVFEGFRTERFRILEYATALMLPVKGKVPAFEFDVRSESVTSVTVSLMISSKPVNYTPEHVLESHKLNIPEGESIVKVDFAALVEEEQYAFIVISSDSRIEIGVTDRLVCGIATVLNQKNEAVSNTGCQTADGENGFESFAFWCPERRPLAANLALRFMSPIDMYSTDRLLNAYKRPYVCTNAWAGSPADSTPSLRLKWDRPQTISRVTLFFDADFDHAMEPIQMGHPDEVMPQCVQRFRIKDAGGRVLYETADNHLATCRVRFDGPVVTDALTVELFHPQKTPATIYHLIVK